ncbi:hypothetical protein [Shouchella lehensis]|uniref:Uncharacterized protein n=1 Tax=Shouchella lehensis G1 TaxID=1246626 RepID=A0A060M575_9BACI|nr:hypothetical protein [Shouchella lehensis]AIC95713.1 hypothetical protein BleG1_3149 [Shouchella lehensis G1]
MYRIVRYVDGIAETSKDLHYKDKTFTEFASAETEAKKLNLDLILLDNDVWKIENI